MKIIFLCTNGNLSKQPFSFSSMKKGLYSIHLKNKESQKFAVVKALIRKDYFYLGNKKLSLSNFLSYFIGLLEADGMIGVSFISSRSNLTIGNMRWRISITQVNRANILKDIHQNFQRKLNICVYLNSKNENTATALEFSTLNSLKKLINLIDQTYSGDNPFKGVKARTYDLLCWFLKNFENLTTAQKIGLVFSFHKTNQYEPDTQKKFSRLSVCQRFNVNISLTYSETESILTQIDLKYKKHIKELKKSMLNQVKKIVDPYYLTGLMDGDGSYLIHSFLFKVVSNVPICFFECSVRLITNNDSLILHDIYRYSLKLQTRGSYSRHRNATSVIWTNRTDLKKIRQFCLIYSPISQMKYQQFQLLERVELARDLCSKKNPRNKNYPFRNWAFIHQILIDWYTIGEKNKTNFRRKFPTLNEAIQKSRQHLKLIKQNRTWSPW